MPPASVASRTTLPKSGWKRISPSKTTTQLTGFSNSEEEAVGLSGVVPFLLEDMLKENTATYTRGDDWAPHIVVDGKLITGQNPASSEGAAKAVVQALQEA